MSWTSGSGKLAGRHTITHRWGWFVGLGVVLVLVGIFAWFEVVAVTLASVIFIGAAMLVGGVFQIVHAFMMRGWGSFLLSLIMGVLYVLGGLLIMDEPLAGSVAITLFLAVVLVVAGIMRIVMALQHRDMAGWGLMLASGIVTLLIGLMLYLTLPWSGLWVLGTLIAVELVVHGITWIRFGLALRARNRALI